MHHTILYDDFQRPVLGLKSLIHLSKSMEIKYHDCQMR